METLKNKQKCPFLGGKTRFFLYYKAKKGKEQKTNQKKQKYINLEGLGPSEVALWATSPDPETLQNTKQTKNQKTKKETKKTRRV